MLVPSPVVYRVLVPDHPVSAVEESPLLLCLHGGVGGHEFFDQLVPIVQDMWKTATLPEMFVVTPEAHSSFYLDYRDGSQKWETFIITELLPHIRERYRVSRQRHRTIVGGISMGGMGALRLGLKHLDIFAGIVAWEPSVEPAFQWKDVKFEDRFWRSTECMEARFGHPFDEVYWATNNPATIALTRGNAIRASGIRVYLEAGADDVYGLDRGAEFMHRTLYDHGIKHEYRYVYGADHIGPTISRRLRDGLAFVGKMLEPDMPDPRVRRLRELVAIQKRRRDVQDRSVSGCGLKQFRSSKDQGGDDGEAGI
jgi:S-formylglutathione hydrolase